MGAGEAILGALKVVGEWVLNNPNVALGAVDTIAKLQADKKSLSTKEQLMIVEEKVNQLGAAAMELDQKIDTEVATLRKQMRTLKIMLLVTSAVLCAAVITAILLAVF